MLWFKKKEIIPRHTCYLNKSLGKYYKLYRTSYRNCFDNVRIYERKQCECGAYRDICISSNEFLPSLFNSASEEKEFIQEIKKNGINEEYELNLRTNMQSYRTDCFCG